MVQIMLFCFLYAIQNELLCSQAIRAYTVVITQHNMQNDFSTSSTISIFSYVLLE